MANISTISTGSFESLLYNASLMSLEYEERFIHYIEVDKAEHTFHYFASFSNIIKNIDLKTYVSGWLTFKTYQLSIFFKRNLHNIFCKKRRRLKAAIN